jgi:hypothetical protein
LQVVCLDCGLTVSDWRASQSSATVPPRGFEAAVTLSVPPCGNVPKALSSHAFRSSGSMILCHLASRPASASTIATSKRHARKRSEFWPTGNAANAVCPAHPQHESGVPGKDSCGRTTVRSNGRDEQTLPAAERPTRTSPQFLLRRYSDQWQFADL